MKQNQIKSHIGQVAPINDCQFKLAFSKLVLSNN